MAASTLDVMGLAATRKRSQLNRYRSNRLLIDSVPTGALLKEAEALTARLRLRAATDVLATAAANAGDTDRRLVLERLAVTAADAGRHNISSEAVYRLQELAPPTADTWVAFAQVALARNNYEHADTAARSALSIEPDHHRAWATLSASYAGLGWFDEADSCLHRIDSDQLDELDRWRIGRATNRWAFRTRGAIAGTAVGALFLGILALTVMATVPFAVRRRRLRLLGHHQAFAHLTAWAADAWRFEWRVRLAHSAVFVAAVGGYVLYKLG